ncbi:hypothetical protein [Thauera aromatica]|uniref:hypothetical protein n=1 Tax=Thauera aromatica TaxID=59405 RepID=UPI000D1692F3|nr:hypothetical protein [Thauera aromatica]MCK2095694.1 hypothetical protein [Thauera aromatica]
MSLLELEGGLQEGLIYKRHRILIAGAPCLLQGNLEIFHAAGIQDGTAIITDQAFVQKYLFLAGVDAAHVRLDILVAGTVNALRRRRTVLGALRNTPAFVTAENGQLIKELRLTRQRFRRLTGGCRCRRILRRFSHDVPHPDFLALAS